MSSKKATVLKFELSSTGNPFQVIGKFFPNGETFLNRTTWRGKEPRSCAVTNANCRSVSGTGPNIFDIEIEYRPKGCITYAGNIPFNGWTAQQLNRAPDGTLLDEQGNPLPDVGLPPVYLSKEVYRDVEFNDMDFGAFVGESDAPGIPHISYHDFMQQLSEGKNVSLSVKANFLAPRRDRQPAKIVLSDVLSGVVQDQHGIPTLFVDRNSEHLSQVLMNHVTKIVCNVIEGRQAIKGMSNDNLAFFEFDDLITDHASNEKDELFRKYIPDDFLENLAKQLMATYEVDVSVIDEGDELGLVLKRPSKEQP